MMNKLSAASWDISSQVYTASTHLIVAIPVLRIQDQVIRTPSFHEPFNSRLHNLLCGYAMYMSSSYFTSYFDGFFICQVSEY